MVTSRDRHILVLLMVNAGVNAANTSVYLAALLPPKAVAVVGLLSAVLSAVTGIYVTITRETETPGTPQA